MCERPWWLRWHIWWHCCCCKMVFDSPSTLICDVECFLHGIGTQTHGNTLPPKRDVGLRHTSQHPTPLVGATRALMWGVVLCSISLQAAWRYQPHSSHYHLLSCGNPCHACTPGHWPCPTHAAVLLWRHNWLKTLDPSCNNMLLSKTFLGQLFRLIH